MATARRRAAVKRRIKLAQRARREAGKPPRKPAWRVPGDRPLWSDYE
jgi:hypothetical protein